MRRSFGFDPLGRTLRRYYAQRPGDARTGAARERLRRQLGANVIAVSPAGVPHPLRRRRLRPALILVPLLLLVMTGSAFALRSMINLGPSTSAVPQNVPLGDFTHIKTAVRKFGRVEVLFIASQNDSLAAPERWSLVKALEQFGQFSGLRSLGGAAASSPGTAPTFDLTHATYRSRYVYFDHRELYGPRAVTNLFDPMTHRLISHAPALQKLTPEEAHDLRRYGNIGFPADYYPANYGINTAAQRYALRLRTGTPLMELVGDYVMNSPYISVDEMTQTATGTPISLSFDDVQKALQAGYQKPYVAYVYDIDAETNILTALICHADGRQPAKVCGRSAIKHLLRRVR